MVSYPNFHQHYSTRTFRAESRAAAALRVAAAGLDAHGNETGETAKAMTNAIIEHDVNGVHLEQGESNGVGKLQHSTLPGSNTAEEAKIFQG